MTKKINADMIVKAFKKFSGIDWDEMNNCEPMTVGKYFVVKTNADNIYRIDTAAIKEVCCCYDCDDGKDVRFDFKIEVYNRIKGFIMDFDCFIYTNGKPTVDDLDELVFQFEGIDCLF